MVLYSYRTEFIQTWHRLECEVKSNIAGSELQMTGIDSDLGGSKYMVQYIFGLIGGITSSRTALKTGWLSPIGISNKLGLLNLKIVTNGRALSSSVFWKRCNSSPFGPWSRSMGPCDGPIIGGAPVQPTSWPRWQGKGTWQFLCPYSLSKRSCRRSPVRALWATAKWKANTLYRWDPWIRPCSNGLIVKK